MKQEDYFQKRVRAAHIYTLVLRLYPATYRQTFGQPMLQTFQDHYRDAIETEGESEWHFWLGVVSDEGNSLLREHIAELREGDMLMKALKQTLFVGLPIALPCVLDPVGWRMDAVLFSSYLVLFILLACFLRTVPPSGIGHSWVRIGLVVGGIMALYFTTINILYAVVPITQGSNSFAPDETAVWLISLPLLGGMVGVLGGYAGGKVRTGLAACLLAGSIGVLGYAISQGVLVALLWNALAHQFLQSHLQRDYLDAIQFYNLHNGPPVTLWNFLLYGSGQEKNGSAMNYLIGGGVVSLLVEGVFAVSGATLGAAVSYRANDAGNRETTPVAQYALTRPIGFAFLSLVLALLTWVGLAAMQNALSDGPPLSLSVLGSFFAGDTFALWLLGFLVALASVLVVARPKGINREGRSYS